jgi:hypothetical protein
VNRARPEGGAPYHGRPGLPRPHPMPDLRRSVHLLVVLHLVLSTQGLLFVQGMFALRRDYVAERLCVNRDRPEEDCHGRCFLNERLRDREERERRADGLAVQLAVTFHLPESDVATDLPPPPEREAPPFAVAREAALPAGVGAAVFHPPRGA